MNGRARGQRDRTLGESPERLLWFKKYVSGELGVKVPALDDTRSARLNGEEEAAVFELYSTDQGC
jgi:hypothetical protein